MNKYMEYSVRTWDGTLIGTVTMTDGKPGRGPKATGDWWIATDSPLSDATCRALLRDVVGKLIDREV